MGGINLDAMAKEWFKDPQEKENKIYCDCCEQPIIEGEHFVKIPNKYNFCMDCIDNWTITAQKGTK